MVIITFFPAHCESLAFELLANSAKIVYLNNNFAFLFWLISGSYQQHGFVPKLDFTDEQILRLIGATGDQQIISREYINGEHHILTRNENGEHIITRIVTVSASFVLAKRLFLSMPA